MENLRREEKEVAEILIPCPFFFAISRLPEQRSNRFIQSSTIEFRSFSIRDNDGTREERQKATNPWKESMRLRIMSEKKQEQKRRIVREFEDSRFTEKKKKKLE